MQGTIKCFCCSHIKTATLDDRLYTILQTGREYDGYKIPGVLGDNTGDNISVYKDIYDGLLTGMYWIWKNTDYDYVGMCSYRAYLASDNKNVLKLEDVQRIFGEEDIDFIAAFDILENSVEEQFMTGYKLLDADFGYHPIEYLCEVIQEYYPHYCNAFELSMKECVINHRHTMIAKRDVFNGYCEWLFSVLKKYMECLEQRKCQMIPRFLGYIAERLERVWLLNNNIKVKELPIIMLSEQDKGI